MALSFAVLGAGALGSLVGGRLAEAGAQVFLIGRKGHVDAVARRGLTIEGVRGRAEVRVGAGTSLAELPLRPDVWVLTAKLGDTAGILAELAPRLDDRSVLLTFQNGVPIDLMAEAGVRGRLLAAVTGWAATLERDGVVTQTSDGEVVVGGDPRRVLATREEGVKALAGVLGAVSPTRIVDDVSGHLWVKLLVSTLYAVLAVGRMSFGDAMVSSAAKRVAFRVWTEGYQVARGLGVALEKYLGVLEPEMLVVRNMQDYMRASFVLDVMVRERRSHRPSVLQDLERGRPTEVPYLNGHVVRQARRLGLPTPMNDLVIRMIQEIERGARRPGKANIALLERALIFGAEKVGLGAAPTGP